MMGGGVKDDPHMRGDLRAKGEQLPVIAFDFGSVKTTSNDGVAEHRFAMTPQTCSS